MSNLGIRFVFQDLGDHGGSSAPAWIPGLNTYIKIIRVNRGGDRLIVLHKFNPQTVAWEVFDEFSQRRGDWDYNVGDVGIAAGWDGSLLITTNAGDGSGKSEIRDATAYYPPSATGFPAASAAPQVHYESIDQHARDQLAAFSGAVQAAITKANDAANSASDIKRTVKTEVENAVKKITLNTATMLKAVSDDIALGLKKDANGNRQGVLIHALWQVIESALKDMLWAMGIKGAK